ncbi:uncharacterized protein EDB93DRAFT_1256337 [Suillus bovinus]|uniref:uncharacterized protein n=1 Tax=Suillus bovinus TaxID=48563 RepID=UPI001B87A6A2|nr:uncharacterized protein EDB93DRAFT_1256337 [Suillus bovinus]KAG2129209.1 hypothetical protein EDB93DRAFT_1256337 [Suillus bovinus]
MDNTLGGFCATTYLSFHSDGLKEVFIAGGIPPVVDSPNPVYEALVVSLVRVEEQRKVYYAKYPQEVPNRQQCSHSEQREPGNNLAGSLERMVGFDLLRKDGFSYYMLRRHRSGSSARVPSDHRLGHVWEVLHEPIYCQGCKAGWSAQPIIQKNDKFVWEKVRLMSDDVPIYFMGQMVCLLQQAASVIGNLEQLITGQSFHNGIRKRMESILTTLFELSKRERD